MSRGHPDDPQSPPEGTTRSLSPESGHGLLMHSEWTDSPFPEKAPLPGTHSDLPV